MEGEKAMTTRVVHINDNIEGAVYVGRAVPRRGIKASKWANPYKIGDVIDGVVLSRPLVIARYRLDLVNGPKRHMLAELPELRGKPLACWCCHDGQEIGPDTSCHGHVLQRLLERYTDDELRAMGGQP